MISIITVFWVPTYAIAEQPLKSFQSKDGRCKLSELAKLRSAEADGGFTFVTQPARVFVESGLSPLETDVVIPAMTALRCHARDGDKILVSSDDEGYCGWIENSTILSDRKRVETPLDGTTIFPGNAAVCGNVAPLSLKDFCGKLNQLDSPLQKCQLPSVKNSPFETKFLVWNAGTSQQGDATIENVEIPLYRSPKAENDDAFKTVKIFNVLRVFDVDRSKTGVRYLIGANHKRMEGWVDQQAGAIWYSKLAMFFKEDADRDVFLDIPSATSNSSLATKPDNIEKMLAGKQEFRRYPVLADNRKIDPDDPPGKRPHLEIAFIGIFCGENNRSKLCTGTSDDGAGVSDTLNILNRADILFLIDATNSMKTYFGLVARAVKDIAAEYTGTPDYQFGVALYGDHTKKGHTSLNDPLQFRMPIPLTPIFEESEFDKLGAERMYIGDAQGDLNEASHSALLKSINSVKWRGEEPRFIIHIADHGDRLDPPEQLMNALRDKRIFYMPVAVRGEYNKQANQRFYEQARKIYGRHLTPDGHPMGVEPQKTYTAGTPLHDPESEYNAIAKALKGAVDQGKAQREYILDQLYKPTKQQKTETEFGASVFPPGYAKMLGGIRELYGINVDDLEHGQRPIAARGYVETAQLDKPEKNWEYFASLRPQNLAKLQHSFENLCGGILQSDARKELVEALRQVISVLTGDQFENDGKFQEYFANKENIPLASQTILGSGLQGLARDLGNTSKAGLERVARYQREVCRTATLISLIQGNQRLARPIENGDLRWDQNRKRYRYTNAQQFDWIFADDFGERVMFLPLSYLPKAPDEVNDSTALPNKM